MEKIAVQKYGTVLLLCSRSQKWDLIGFSCVKMETWQVSNEKILHTNARLIVRKAREKVFSTFSAVNVFIVQSTSFSFPMNYHSIVRLPIVDIIGKSLPKLVPIFSVHGSFLLVYSCLLPAEFVV